MDFSMIHQPGFPSHEWHFLPWIPNRNPPFRLTSLVWPCHPEICTLHHTAPLQTSSSLTFWLVVFENINWWWAEHVWECLEFLVDSDWVGFVLWNIFSFLFWDGSFKKHLCIYYVPCCRKVDVQTPCENRRVDHSPNNYQFRPLRKKTCHLPNISNIHFRGLSDF